MGLGVGEMAVRCVLCLGRISDFRWMLGLLSCGMSDLAGFLRIVGVCWNQEWNAYCFINAAGVAWVVESCETLPLQYFQE